MSSPPRIDLPGHVYHAYNRANGGGTMFRTEKDYAAFEALLFEAMKEYALDIYAYSFMPNHWHFTLSPREPGGMGSFFQWLTSTHVKRWHAAHDTVGSGHLYQGTFKSNMCSPEPSHFLRLVRYVERNALRAKLVERAEDWRWGSAWLRTNGSEKQKAILAPWPVDMPEDYLWRLNEPMGEQELEPIRKAIKRGSPFGPDAWCERMVSEFGLESTVRPRGRPKKEP